MERFDIVSRTDDTRDTFYLDSLALLAEFKSAKHRSGPTAENVIGDKTTSKLPAIFDSTASRKILEQAANADGDKLWSHSSKDLKASRDGIWGCAISTRGVLNRAGFDYFRSPKVSGQIQEALDHGWKIQSPEEKQPGDLIIAFDSKQDWITASGHSHVGIISDDLQVYNNSIYTHTWRKDPEDQAFDRHFEGRMVLRPPKEF
jgi:hypothetical protein